MRLFLTLRCRCHYETLGLKRSATKEQIKSAYYKMSKEFHPDMTHGNPDTFRRITMAYEILGNPEKKAEYDQTLGRTGPYNEYGFRTRPNDGPYYRPPREPFENPWQSNPYGYSGHHHPHNYHFGRQNSYRRKSAYDYPYDVNDPNYKRFEEWFVEKTTWKRRPPKARSYGFRVLAMVSYRIYFFTILTTLLIAMSFSTSDVDETERQVRQERLEMERKYWEENRRLRKV